MISQLIQRTQRAVEELDNQNYRHQKMLLSGAGLDEVTRDDDIESEPPRYSLSLSLTLSHSLSHSLTLSHSLSLSLSLTLSLSHSLSLSLSLTLTLQ